MNRPVRVVVVRLAFLLLAACALAFACWLGWRPAGAAAAAPDAYACPMHLQVQTATPGDCSICGMALERNERGHGHAQYVVAFPGTPSDAARFLSYGRGPVQRRTLRSPLDAPAWVDDTALISAVLYEDELRALGVGAATFEAASGPRLAVTALAEPAVRWDQVRWLVKFRAAHAPAAPPAGGVGRLRAALAPREVLAVLSAAVLPSAEGPGVLVVSPDRRGVTRRPIEVGRSFSGYTSVLSGVVEGELVVVMNGFFLDAERRLQGTEPAGAVPVR